MFFPVLCHLKCLFGQTAQLVALSAAGLDFALDIVGKEDREIAACGRGGLRHGRAGQDEEKKEEKRVCRIMAPWGWSA